VADMPDTGASRKRQIAWRRIPGDLAARGRPSVGLDRVWLSGKSVKQKPWRRRHGLTTRFVGSASITRPCYLCNIHPKIAG
jgi:hypothetical protein